MLYNLTRYGKRVFGPAEYNACLMHCQKIQDRSYEWAKRWSGYNITETRDLSSNEQHKTSLETSGRLIGKNADDDRYFAFDGKVYLIPQDFSTGDVCEVCDFHVLCDGLRKGWFTGFIPLNNFHLPAQV